MYSDWKMFRPFATSHIIQNNAQLQRNMREHNRICMRKNGVYFGNVEIRVITRSY